MAFWRFIEVGPHKQIAEIFLLIELVEFDGCKVVGHECRLGPLTGMSKSAYSDFAAARVNFVQDLEPLNAKRYKDIDESRCVGASVTRQIC